jgi:hypothetical protein
MIDNLIAFFLGVVLTISAFIILGALLGVSALPDKTTLTSPLLFLPSQTSAWNKLSEDMLASNAKEITINWSGSGGETSEGEQFIRKIQDVQAQGKKIILAVRGVAYSMHAFVICFADSYTMAPQSSITFHAPKASDGSSLPRAFLIQEEFFLTQCVSKGILTSNEATEIMINDKQVVIDSQGNRYVDNDN